MALRQMEFEIATADFLEITDLELSELLAQVYVAGGYTEPDEAVSLFEPSAVRKRGVLISSGLIPRSLLRDWVSMISLSDEQLQIHKQKREDNQLTLW